MAALAVVVDRPTTEVALGSGTVSFERTPSRWTFDLDVDFLASTDRGTRSPRRAPDWSPEIHHADRTAAENQGGRPSEWNMFRPSRRALQRPSGGPDPLASTSGASSAGAHYRPDGWTLELRFRVLRAPTGVEVVGEGRWVRDLTPLEGARSGHHTRPLIDRRLRRMYPCQPRAQ